jgi:alginate O-acetyltransferase complex protein AlgI
MGPFVERVVVTRGDREINGRMASRMIFNSLIFALFYAIVLAGYFSVANWKLRKAFLIFASFIFYASYRPIYVLVLLIPILFDFCVALRLNEIKRHGVRKALLISSLALNLGFLAYFKYTNFALENVASLAWVFGSEVRHSSLDIFLPIGISFHVFQSMAYVIDTYKRDIRPTKSLLDFMLFVSFFPQLVAGPIVRASEFLPQLERPRRVMGQDFGWAATLITIGIFEKVVLADGILGPIVDKVYQLTPSQVGATDAWLGTLAFAGQIFFDFNGYSLCAVGSALALGFHLPWNFRFPYAAIGFSDFWQRWHISLSKWIRDYVYIPLGGNRYGATKTFRNLLVAMLLAGLWHGAAWHFVVWGLLHGAFLVMERGAQICKLWPQENSALINKVVAAAVTFFCVCIAWVFFRAGNLEHALLLLQQMFDPFGDGGRVLQRVDRYGVLFVMGGLLATQAVLRDMTLEGAISAAGHRVLAISLAFMLIAIMSVGGEVRGFIYFQF